jgi:hypothetical protein
MSSNKHLPKRVFYYAFNLVYFEVEGFHQKNLGQNLFKCIMSWYRYPLHYCKKVAILGTFTTFIFCIFLQNMLHLILGFTFGV